MPQLAENLRDRSGRERATNQSSLPDTIAGWPGLLWVAVLLIAVATGCGNKPKERDRCTERLGKWTIADMKERHPQDKWDIICDPKTGAVYASLKQLDGGVDSGKKSD